MRKKLLAVAMSALVLLGVGGALAPAHASTPPAPVTMNANAPLCMHLYGLNLGYCWFGLHGSN